MYKGKWSGSLLPVFCLLTIAGLLLSVKEIVLEPGIVTRIILIKPGLFTF